MADKDPVIETIDIAEVTAHASKKGKKFWKAKTTDDEYYTIWKEDVKDRLRPGVNTVTVDLNDTGDMVFRNIVGIAAAGPSSESFWDDMDKPDQAAKPAAQRPSLPIAQQPSPLTPLQHARAIGIQTAAKLIAGGVGERAELVPMAERVCKYILDGAGEQKTSSIEAREFVE